MTVSESGTGAASRRRPKRSELVAAEIVEEIAGRGLRPGDLLAPEGAMLDHYGIGRASLREGLRLLESQGVVSLKPGPGGGPVVGHVEAANLARTANLYFRLAGSTYRELADALLFLEPWLAELAAKRPDRPEVRSHLESALAETDLVRDDPAGIVRTAPGFHQAIAALSGNLVLGIFSSAIAETFTTHVLGGIELGPHQGQFLAAHHDLADAIIGGHPVRAHRLAAEHFRDIIDYCDSQAPGRLDDTVEWR